MTTITQKIKSPYTPIVFDRTALQVFNRGLRYLVEANKLTQESFNAAGLAQAMNDIQKSEKPLIRCIIGGEFKVYCTRSARWLRWETWVRKHCANVIPEGWQR